jgi:hypothetical protein
MPVGAASEVRVTKQLPAGKWWVSGNTNGFYDITPGSTFRCVPLVNGTQPEPAQALGFGSGDTLTRATKRRSPSARSGPSSERRISWPSGPTASTSGWADRRRPTGPRCVELAERLDRG